MTSDYKSLNSNDYRIVRSNGEEFNFNIVTDYIFKATESVIKNESATGDGGVTYANGRKQESIPMSGILLARTQTELREKETKLVKIKDNGEVIDLVTPFKIDIRSNKYIIEEIEFIKKNATQTSTPFNILLTEKRSSNVKHVAANLVNYQSAEFMKEYYNSLIGNTI